MEMIDTTALNVLLGFQALAALVGLLLVAVVLAKVLPVTRRERLARRESIPTYYGRLHFTA
ncbi:hypothetical protein EXE58_01830 [Nocardioides seonyuensis]|uniref:Uncharacterized protein n=1 Tax=Nocardioides seonyuensis TaxID=2518371 RepID=A0A4P7IBA6_9ACTN|nr:hypothetical protein [Nocardioides seonyuensis]QBX54334.1 hypothetical protein EXE58_01830 [Nocardioides seonyuensis]